MRRPRLELPGIPLHITHRGVNRGATFIDDDDHASYFDALRVAAMLTCLRYIELNPVRAGLAAFPWEYRWSSVHANLHLQPCPLLQPHPTFMALGEDTATRAARYREVLMEPLGQDQLDAVREHMRQERVLGSPRFQAMVEKTLQRPVCVRHVGRPAKAATSPRGADSKPEKGPEMFSDPTCRTLLAIRQ